MKKLILLLALASTPCFATAFGAQTAWDVQTTGLDTNGGAYDPGVASPGTDESMGSGTAVTITLASSTTGTSSPVFSATTHGPGNFIDITGGSGCTTGRYELLSQSSGTGTFNVAMGTTGNVCTGTLGGSLLTNATAFSGAVANNTIWTQAGTYTLTVGVAWSTSNLKWRGYSSAHGDITVTNGLAKPLITTATNSVTLVTFGFGTSIITHLENLAFSNTAATRATGFLFSANGAAAATVVNCTFAGFTDGVQGANTPQALLASDSEFLNNTARGIAGNFTWLLVDKDFIYGTGTGSTCSTSNAGVVNSVGGSGYTIISNSVIAAGTSCGVTIAPSANPAFLSITKSTIANNASDGVLLSASNTSFSLGIVIEGNILYGNGGYGVNADTAMTTPTYTLTTNAVGSNTSGNYHNLTSEGGDIALSANPFTSSTNFLPNATVGGGAALKGLGLPSTFNSPATVGAPDLGAVQSSCSGGSGQFACGFSANKLPVIH